MTEFAHLLREGEALEWSGRPVAWGNLQITDAFAIVAAAFLAIWGGWTLWGNYWLWSNTFGGALPLSSFLLPRTLLFPVLAFAVGGVIAFWSVIGPYLRLRHTSYALGRGRVFVANGAPSRRSAFVTNLSPTALLGVEKRGRFHCLILSTRTTADDDEGAEILAFENLTADDFAAALALIKSHDGGPDA